MSIPERTVPDPAATGGGTLTGGFWNPSIPNPAPNAKSDSFPGTTLDAKWTQWDPAGIQTVTVNDGLTLEHTSGASYQWAGIHQESPTDNYFAITAPITLAATEGSFTYTGLFVAEDLTAGPTTGGLFCIGPGVYTNAVIGSYHWVNYNNYGGAIWKPDGFGSGLVYRIVVDRVGAFIHGYVSPNGAEGTWWRWGSYAIGGNVAVVDKIGIGVCANDAEEAHLKTGLFDVDILAGVTYDDVQFATGALQTVS